MVAYTELAGSGSGPAGNASAGTVLAGEANVGVPPSAAPHPSTRAFSGAPGLSSTKTQPGTVISMLPGTGNQVALTVDDGTNSAVVRAYLEFVKSTGVRLTFFPNGRNPSWTEHAQTLRPLIDSGQVQIGNHTWSHPDLRGLSDSDIADEITRNEAFFKNTFGISSRPFLRPPFGFHNDRVDRIAAGLGYTTIAMWYGSLADSSVLTADEIMTNARKWLTARRIVIGHANHLGITQAYPRLLELIRERNLQTVTLNDIFATT
ncbi:MAG: polysaccharide deacetylase family protein [Actinomycetota bacterium]|nr:polysaccharide deacetylase family protein [Actinomycetota bacterium]